jgi:hypothetical protein
MSQNKVRKYCGIINLRLHDPCHKVKSALSNVDEPIDGNSRKELSDSALCHHRSGSAIECDGLEDPPFAHTAGIAIHLAPELHCKADDKLQDQASSEAA